MDGYSHTSSDSETGTPPAGAGRETRSDPLAELERRWDKLVKMVQGLRDENAALWDQLQGREDHVSRIEAELAAKKEEIAGLHAEQKRTNERIDGLLSRFDDPEQ
ncbi:MAG: cell division protein ZapB [Magnetococcus sp. XQGC-1]